MKEAIKERQGGEEVESIRREQIEIDNGIIHHNVNSPLPDGWRWVKLEEACQEVYRYPTYYNITYVDKGVPEIRGELINKDGTLEMDSTKYRFISQETSKRFPRTILKEGDFVLSVRGTMGKTALIPKELEGANITANLIRISPVRSMIYSPFLRMVFLSELFQLTLKNLSPQTTIRTIKAPVLRSIPIPLPSMSEQKRIAAKVQGLMKEVEHARVACEKQLEAAKMLPSSYLRQLFESEEAKKWEKKTVEEVCEYGSGIWGDEPDNSFNCYPILRSNNIREGKMVFDEIAIRKVQPRYVTAKALEFGDILVATSSGSKDLVGKSAIFVPSDNKVYLFSNFTMRLRANLEVMDACYLYFYLQSPRAKKVLQLIQDTTTGLRNLDRKEFLNQLIPIPPLSEQHRIAAKLREKIVQVEKLHTSIENQLEALNTLFQAISRKAFRGEL